MFGAGHAGVAVQVRCGDVAAPRRGQLPQAVGVAFGDAVQAVAQVALQGAHVHAELLGQLVLVQGFALVQAGQDGRQAVGQFFAFGVGCWVGRHGGMNGLWVALERL